MIAFATVAGAVVFVAFGCWFAHRAGPAELARLEALDIDEMVDRYPGDPTTPE